MEPHLPTVDVTTADYWEAAGQGRLLVSHCNGCESTFTYPRPFCPTCWSEDVRWLEASGRGTVYTYSTVYHNDLPPFNELVPYTTAIVDLVEGPRVMTRITGCEPGDVRVGMDVEAVYEPLDEALSVPVFVPTGQQ